uniref:SynN domain-containing protein n=1 Tax=Ascaris lumbricoides TaxID=6252 RepID=A0A0M3HMN3_ASCLU
MTGSVLHNSNSLSDTVMEEVGMAEDEVDGFLDEAIAAEQREVKKLDERLAVLKEQCHQLECITANLEAIGESPRNLLKAVQIMQKQLPLQKALIKELENERTATYASNANEGAVDNSENIVTLTSHLNALKIERRAKNIVALFLTKKPS